VIVSRLRRSGNPASGKSATSGVRMRGVVVHSANDDAIAPREGRLCRRPAVRPGVEIRDFISPAWPGRSRQEVRQLSENSATGATPARSKPASRAAAFTNFDRSDAPCTNQLSRIRTEKGAVCNGDATTASPRPSLPSESMRKSTIPKPQRASPPAGQ
jgi:hypothetical protein